MKKLNITPKSETVIRFTVGILLIAVGISLFLLHASKVVLIGWESSYILTAITFIWAYIGPIVAITFIVGGLYLMGLIDKIMEKAELN